MTLRCIAGIVTPDEGRITVDGVPFFDSEKKINLTPQERKAGLLFQNYALFNNMTVAENIAAGVREKLPSAKSWRARRPTSGNSAWRVWKSACPTSCPAASSSGSPWRVSSSESPVF